MESDQVDCLAPPVLCHFEEVEDAKEAPGARKFGCDIGETDWLNGVNFDLSPSHAVPSPHPDVGTRPEPDAACDFSAANSLAKALCENHGGSLQELER